MSIKDYIKERWYMFAIAAISFAFAMAVIVLDRSAFAAGRSIAYVLSGIVLFDAIFVMIDYLILKSRAKKMMAFIRNGGTGDYDSQFPLDKKYSMQINELANEYNGFRARTADEKAEELDFITKWVHDVKVPISAMKLLLENDAEDLKEKLDMELSHIEQNTQKVLFHIKSKSFYDDYKISKTGTKSLINASLKPFATFFSYKRIGLDILGEDFDILTDRKWSGYILSQFLSNAVKHTPEDGRIEIATVKKDSGVTICVKNTGSGIEKHDLSRVFFRGYTSSGREQMRATGYGLFLSKKLADKMGHVLHAESEYGKYASFSLTFPGGQNDFM